MGKMAIIISPLYKVEAVVHLALGKFVKEILGGHLIASFVNTRAFSHGDDGIHWRVVFYSLLLHVLAHH